MYLGEDLPQSGHRITAHLHLCVSREPMRQCTLFALICVFGVICYTVHFLPRDGQTEWVLGELRGYCSQMVSI